jgi:hypothetical protein
MQEIARVADSLSSHKSLEAALDRVEYLLEVLDPELQEPAYDLIEKLRIRLEKL